MLFGMVCSGIFYRHMGVMEFLEKIMDLVKLSDWYKENFCKLAGLSLRQGLPYAGFWPESTTDAVMLRCEKFDGGFSIFNERTRQGIQAKIDFITEADIFLYAEKAKNL